MFQVDLPADWRSSVAVYDEVLPSQQFRRLHDDIMGSKFDPVSKFTSYTSGPGRILRGQSKIAHTSIGPEDGMFSELVGALIPVFPDVTSIIGEEKTGWDMLGLSPWIYESGSGLELHVDGPDIYTGMVIFYLHQEWDIAWGGALLIFPPIDPGSMASEKASFGNRVKEIRGGRRALNSLAMKRGIGVSLHAKPNRLIFISPNVPHYVEQVSAGDRIRKRLSILGAFRKSES
jgi:hypothetical protein